MGRQLQLATTPSDEVELLRFIRSRTPIRVLQTFTTSIDELWVDDWETRDMPTTFYIWPQIFAWSPVYAQTGGHRCPPERRGLFYVANNHTAPVLEVRRSFPDKKRYGRIYWGSNFAAPNGLDYDADAFARFTDSVWRWIRKVGRRAPDATTHSPYFLPDAWSRYGNTET